MTVNIQIKLDEGDMTCDTCEGEERCVQDIRWET